jgi:hypothetical protein
MATEGIGRKLATEDKEGTEVLSQSLSVFSVSSVANCLLDLLPAISLGFVDPLEG